MALYTPFFQRSAQTLAAGYGQQRTAKLAQSAYMGDPRAMEELAQIDPNAANQIRQQQMQQGQQQLAQAATRQQMQAQQQSMQANQEQMKQQAQQWALQNREIVQGVMQKVAQMPDFASAQQFLASEIQGLEQSGVKLPQGMSAQTFTPEAFEQIKKAFPAQTPSAVSDVGKIAQDLRNGIITQEAFQAEMAKLGEDPTEAYIRGLEAQRTELALEKDRMAIADKGADAERAAEQEVGAQQALLDQSEMMAGFLKEAYDLTKTAQSGYTGAALAAISPSGQNAALRRKLDTVKANIGFDKLMEMKRASPTGGALGAVSERELMFLQATLGALDAKSSDAEIQDALGKIYNIYQRINTGAGGAGLPPLAPTNLQDMSSDDLVNMLTSEASQ